MYVVAIYHSKGIVAYAGEIERVIYYKHRWTATGEYFYTMETIKGLLLACIRNIYIYICIHQTCAS